VNAALASARTAAQRLVPAARAPLLLYAAFTAILFVVFLVATFPHDLLVRRILSEALPRTLAVDLRGSSVGWGLAASIDDLRLLQSAGDPKAPVLAVEGLRVAPSLLGLLTGSPYPLRTSARLYGGTLQATLDTRPASLDIDARLTDLDLGRYVGLPAFAEGVLRGRVNTAVTLRGDADRPNTLDGTVAFSASQLAAEGLKVRGLTLPDLHFSQAQVGGTVTKGRLTITELRGAGEEVSVAGEGSVLLRMPLTNSVLNLDLTLTPAANAPEGLKLALNLLPGSTDAAGARTVHLAGTIGQPRAR
jgi:type II secretion system protein N